MSIESEIAEFPPELVAYMAHYAGSDALARRMVTVEIRNIDDGEFEALPTTPQAMVRWIEAAMDEAPKEYRDKLGFSLAYEAGYYDERSSSSLTIGYERPETDEEMIGRINGYIYSYRENVMRDRANYEALKKKFEGA